MKQYFVVRVGCAMPVDYLMTKLNSSLQAVIFHLGDDTSGYEMEEIDVKTQDRPSTLGTGGGTDYDQDTIIGRPTYRWEQLLDDPLRRGNDHKPRWLAKMRAWFGISPFWSSGDLSKGVALDLRLENGRYELIDDHDQESEN
jgi:hypothetical protein